MQTWIAAGVAGQRLDELQFRIVRPDGTVRFVLGRGELRYDAENRPLRMIGTAEDITERKRTHEALSESEGKYRALVEQQSLVGIFLVDGEKVLYQNPCADEIFGYQPGELVGRPIKTLVVEGEWPAMEREMGRLVSGEIPILKLDFQGRRKDGREVIINAHATLARSGGRPILIGVLQDVTGQRHAERHIQHHVAQLEAAFMHTVEVATTLSEMRDPYTAGHERRVAEIAVAISAELGFDARRQQGLRIAGYLHDVGKITVPLEILAKPGRLNAAEFALVKGHPQASYAILKNVEFPWPVAQVALQHHERMNGSGYPQGLKGEAILFEARVMAVADVIEAMASHRPYRPGLGVDQALAEIERGRGSAYDPIVVDACLKLFREKGYQLPRD
jgi:PAS domain S-box-containing protein